MPGCRVGLRRSAPTYGNGSALEVVLHDYALYKSTFTLLYFTLLYKLWIIKENPRLVGRIGSGPRKKVKHVSRRWSPQANPTARHQRTLRDHVIRVGVSRDMPVYSPGYAGYSFGLGRLRLSRPGCLVPRPGGLPVQRRSPAWALTGPSVEYLYVDQPERVTATLNRQPCCFKVQRW